MEVACPKCKVKLKIPDEKISPEGTRFKCPKCTTVLLVKKPVQKQAQELDKKKVLLALADRKAFEEMGSLLEAAGLTVITSPDGVDAMVTAVRELPYVAVLDAALPKIYGFEVCKRLKSREDTKDMKIILFNSYYDKNKYKRPPTTLYGADEYIEGHEVQLNFLDKVQALISGVPLPEPSGASAPFEPGEEEAFSFEMPARSPAAAQPPTPSVPPVTETPEVRTTAVGATGVPTAAGEWETKARRLARTVLADVFLYNTDKAKNALKTGNFLEVFIAEVNEGRKLYESRIPKDVRDSYDYFTDEVNNFLVDKKKQLNLQ